MAEALEGAYSATVSFWRLCTNAATSRLRVSLGQAQAGPQQRFADAEAAALVRRALALWTDLPGSSRREVQEIELLMALGASLFTTQGYASAVRPIPAFAGGAGRSLGFSDRTRRHRGVPE